MRHGTIPLAGFLCLAAVLPAGCDKMDWWKRGQSQPAPDSRTESDDSEATSRPAGDPNASAPEEAILRAQVKDLQVREAQMSERLGQLESLTAQQEKMISVLGKVPGERDAYKQQVEALQKEIQRLREELRLRGAEEKVIFPRGAPTIPSPSASPAPASAPAPANP